MEKHAHTYEYYLHFYIRIIRKENFHHRFSTFRIKHLEGVNENGVIKFLSK